MCGIAAAASKEAVEKMLDAVAHRGPDARGIEKAGDWWLGHVRLAIIDLDPRSNQPMIVGSTAVAYNGETWNWKNLRLPWWGPWRTEGDTEVVAKVLDEWEEAGLELLEGMMGVAWVDHFGFLRVARDRFGEVPVWIHPDGAACSERKGLAAAGYDPRAARLLPPGAVATWRAGRWEERTYYEPLGRTEGDLRGILEDAADERAMSDVPVCVLLSGGLDSSVTAALLAKRIPDLTAYVAVMDPRSKDLAVARDVATHIGIRLIEVEVKPPTRSDLAEVVRVIEQSTKAQVEIGHACLALADAMKSDGFRVTYSGEGADELWGSYGGPLSSNAIITKMSIPMWALYTKLGWYGARKKMVYDQHRKNFLRANNVFMSRGIECRLPWLHRPIMERGLAMSLEEVRSNGRAKGCIEEAMADALPKSVLKRAKLAFQDGLGIKPMAKDITGGRPQAFYAEAERSMMSTQHDLWPGG